MRKVLYFFSAFLGLISCQNKDNKKLRLPIVLGDSTTIVTETDSQYLYSNIPEYATLAIANDSVRTEVQQQETTTDTVKTKPESGLPEKKPKGFEVDFGTMSIIIPEVGLRGKSPVNGQAAYTLINGKINNLTLVADKGSISKIDQQYVTNVFYVGKDKKKFKLNLRDYTSSWERLKNQNTGTLQSGQLSTHQYSSTELKNALRKSLRQSGISRSEERKIMNGIGQYQVGKEGFTSGLEVVRWKISAKDDKGNSHNYRIRIDVPQ